MTRTPGITATGGRVVQDEGRYSRHAHQVRAVFGWNLRALSPWAGVRYRRQSIRLTGDAAAAFDTPQGLVEQQISFVNEFEASGVLADFGLDVRVPHTRLVVRAEGAASGSDVRFHVGLSYGLSGRR